MKLSLIAAGLLTLGLSACATPPQPQAGGQALIAAGTAAPQRATLATNLDQDPRVKTLIAAGVKPLVPGEIGPYLDAMTAALRTGLQGDGVTVSRVGNIIGLVLPADAIFVAGAATIKPDGEAPIVAIGNVLTKFDRTIVDVYGYTDNGAPADYNRKLSQRRAVSVATLLANGGVAQSRFYIEGRGSADPVGPDSTADGRARNRRVQIQIAPLG